jgi:formylglycine-generating enzyme required for sulfatase activity
MIVFSAGAGQQALDKLGNQDTDENGVFTRVFLQEMQQPGLEIHQLLRNVRSRVVQITKSVNHDQMPSLYDQTVGDFYFYEGAPQIASLEPVPTPTGSGISLDDIRKEQDARNKWNKWQQAMEADFYKIETLNAEPEMQKIAWARFLSTYTQNNPYSALDKQLRAKAQTYYQTAQAQQQKQDTVGSGSNSSTQRASPTTPIMVPIPGKNYEMGKYIVTQGEWRAVMGSNPSAFSRCGEACPVEQVSWNDVQEFLRKLNAKSGKQYRLPTEDEWEYACYGGNQTEYCGSDDFNSVAWFGANSKSTTHPVGQKQANGFGLYDMSGNVWEWMSDCFDSSCSRRVLRGGAWYFFPKSHDPIRYSYVPTDRYYGFGFRLARTLP